MNRKTLCGRVLQITVASFLAILLALVQTSHALEASSPVAERHEPKPPISCPGINFPEFFSAFSDSEELQRVFIKTPLKTQRLDLDAKPEPKPIVRLLSRQNIKFPLIPLRPDRDAKSLILRIDKVSGKRAEATLFKNDTDYQVSYFFSKTACWRLDRIEDWSL